MAGPSNRPRRPPWIYTGIRPSPVAKHRYFGTSRTFPTAQYLYNQDLPRGAASPPYMAVIVPTTRIKTSRRPTCREQTRACKGPQAPRLSHTPLPSQPVAGYWGFGRIDWSGRCQFSKLAPPAGSMTHGLVKIRPLAPACPAPNGTAPGDGIRPAKAAASRVIRAGTTPVL